MPLLFNGTRVRRRQVIAPSGSELFLAASAALRVRVVDAATDPLAGCLGGNPPCDGSVLYSPCRVPAREWSTRSLGGWTLAAGVPSTCHNERAQAVNHGQSRDLKGVHDLGFHLLTCRFAPAFQAGGAGSNPVGSTTFPLVSALPADKHARSSTALVPSPCHSAAVQLHGRHRTSGLFGSWR